MFQVACILLALLAVCCNAFKAGNMKSSVEVPTGTILSAQFYCGMPCEENMGFYLSSTTPGTTAGIDNPILLQQYLPPANTAERQLDVFTAFEKSTSTFTTVAVNYPSAQTLTVWTSTITGNDPASMKATPVLTGVEFKYPASSSPAPLNIAPLEIAKIINGPNEGLLAIFTNGEIHTLDVNGGGFKLLNKLIKDERALDVNYPTTLSGHVFDFERNGLWSIVSAGMYAYVMFTDFTTNTVGTWKQLNANMMLDPGVDAVQTDFSPEWFINAMMVDVGDGNGSQLMVQLESVNDNIGFDLLTFVNTTSGYFTGPVYNLMNYNIVLQCKPFNCDKSRLSTFDPITKTVWFQGHLTLPDQEGDIALNGLTFETLKTGTPSYYVSIVNPSFGFGYAGFQYYTF